MPGYFQKPSLYQDQIVFVCEDDLWWVSDEGGVAQRLTAHPGRCTDPCFSPDGLQVAFTGRDEGHNEVHRLDLDGRASERLTFLGADTRVVGYRSHEVLFTTNSWQPFVRIFVLGSVAAAGGPARELAYGPANAIAFEPGGPGIVLGRHTWDPARWKRYRGGTAGRLWIDREGKNEFEPLVNTGGNLTRPLWVGERIYFGSDHEGCCNLYSCNPVGEDLQRHTEHRDFYLRHPNTDGRRIVYQCAASLYLYDPEEGKARSLPVQLRGSRAQKLRKFPNSAHYLESYDVHPNGHSLAVTVRGKAFTFANWEQAPTQLGHRDGVRYRLLSWLHDGERLVCVSDEGGEERLEVHDQDGYKLVAAGFDLGRVLLLSCSPKGNKVLLTNHRLELLLADLDQDTIEVLDRSAWDRIRGIDWSFDGSWVTYANPVSPNTAQIRLIELATRSITEVTSGDFRDSAPAFDPQGRYLYFLSSRTYDPVWDEIFFELSFPRATKAYLVTLREDIANPFIQQPRAPGEEAKKQEKEEDKDKEKDEPARLRIDTDGISRRIVEFPIPEARYWQIEGLKDQVLISSYPIEGSLAEDWNSSAPASNGTIVSYEFRTGEKKDLYTKITGFRVSMDRKTLVYRSAYKLRVVQAGKKPENNEDATGRKTGWVNLTRVRVSVSPESEWRQMAQEAWRLMRDHFWDAQMSGMDWQAIYERYRPLLSKIATRSEFSDWLWEFQGELGTSHAYETGGDYRPEPSFPMGKLATELRWDEAADAYRIASMVQGDSWNQDADCPLRRPGLEIREGDLVLAINGRTLSPDRPPEENLVHCAGSEVQLTVRREDGEPRRVYVRALRLESSARYRQWVESNRRKVHEASQGRLGYVHVPNMGPWGFSEFHRGYLPEITREGLIIDVRYNGGGNVSQLLLEKLSRRPLGWDVPRWGQPVPYPLNAPLGPLVALTNEQAGSDGDMFSHAFKMMKLGPLVGMRTWGGVIGIWPRHRLVDGSQTTQPEYHFWFEDVGWKVENYGTDPDFEVNIAPQDWTAGRDPQLEKALELALAALAQKRPMPDFQVDRLRV